MAAKKHNEERGEPTQFDRWPAPGDRRITQKFGANPGYYEQFGLPGHEGVDLRSAPGCDIVAVWPGVVKLASPDAGHPYGNQVRIAHDCGYESIYAHLSEILVQAGQQVSAGELVGLSGSTGNSTGAHLHLTLKRDGRIVDPTPYLLAAPD